MTMCAECAGGIDDARELYAGCGRFTCRGAQDFRRAVVHYLERQATADLAATAWGPLFVMAAILGTWGGRVGDGAAFGAAVALLVVLGAPVVAVLARLGRARASEVALATVVELAREREARSASPLRRHPEKVARFEQYVTTPLLLGVTVWATVRAAAGGSWIGCGLGAAGLLAGAGLYLGPPRRGLPNPIRDFEAWRREVEPMQAEWRAIRRESGELVRAR